MGRVVPCDVLFLGSFCPLGHLVIGTFCPLGRFFPWDALSVGHTVLSLFCGTFCRRMFCPRPFCLCTVFTWTRRGWSESSGVLVLVLQL